MARQRNACAVTSAFSKDVHWSHVRRTVRRHPTSQNADHRERDGRTGQSQRVAGVNAIQQRGHQRRSPQADTSADKDSETDQR
jgi:hypothetical protein